jgi:hypothetical protein
MIDWNKSLIHSTVLLGDRQFIQFYGLKVQNGNITLSVIEIRHKETSRGGASVIRSTCPSDQSSSWFAFHAPTEKTNELRLIRDPSSASTKRVSIVNTFQMIDRLSSLITIHSFYHTLAVTKELKGGGDSCLILL